MRALADALPPTAGNAIDLGLSGADAAASRRREGVSLFRDLRHWWRRAEVLLCAVPTESRLARVAAMAPARATTGAVAVAARAALAERVASIDDLIDAGAERGCTGGGSGGEIIGASGGGGADDAHHFLRRALDTEAVSFGARLGRVRAEIATELESPPPSPLLYLLSLGRIPSHWAWQSRPGEALARRASDADEWLSHAAARSSYLETCRRDLCGNASPLLCLSLLTSPGAALVAVLRDAAAEKRLPLDGARIAADVTDEAGRNISLTASTLAGAAWDALGRRLCRLQTRESTGEASSPAGPMLPRLVLRAALATSRSGLEAGEEEELAGTVGAGTAWGAFRCPLVLAEAGADLGDEFGGGGGADGGGGTQMSLLLTALLPSNAHSSWLILAGAHARLA